MHYELFYVETFSTLTWLRFSTFKPLKFHIIYPNLSYPILSYPIYIYVWQGMFVYQTSLIYKQSIREQS